MMSNGVMPPCRYPQGRFLHAGCALVLLMALVSSGLFAQNISTEQDSLSPAKLKKMSLEELMQMDITSVSKRAEPFFTSPASIYVITSEDIERAASASLPEALRLAPNLQVVQLDARQWSITARGFNSTVANKLLVLIDGRSVYTTLYAGVFWDVQDIFLPDIDRIEVISGPGATLWGANAVNGVINIITKRASADDQSPFFARITAAPSGRSAGGIHYLAPTGERSSLRTYLKYADRGATYNVAAAGSGDDAWSIVQGGFRFDAVPGDAQPITIQGDVYHGSADQQVGDDLTLAGGNVLGRWSRPLTESSRLQVQSYFDYTQRIIPGTFVENLGTFDFEIQDQTTFLSAHTLVLGLDFRHWNSRVGNSPVLAFIPPDLQSRLFSGFIQDEIALSRAVTLVVGTKLEHNSFSGFEIQPSIRMGWSIDEHQFGWWAVSRAVRTPSRIDQNYFVPAPPASFLLGGPNFTSEKLIAFEAGYRLKPVNDLFFDVAAYFNRYDDLRSVEPVTAATFEVANGLQANTAGLELRARANLTRWWRLSAGYNYLHNNILLKSWSQDLNKGNGEGYDPPNQFIAQTSIQTGPKVDWYGYLRYVDAIDNPLGPVPPFWNLDIGFRWSATDALAFSVMGRNLLYDHRAQFGPPATRSEIRRGISGRVTWTP